MLATFYQRCCKRERHICGFKKLQDIILFAFVFQLQLILKVESGICVVVDVKTDEVANLGIEVDLEILVKVKSCHAPFAGITLWVVTVVVHYLERQFGTSTWCYLDFRLAHEGLELLTDLVETWYFAQQSSVTVVKHRSSSFFIPILAHQLFHLPILIVLKRHIFPAYHHISRHPHLHIVAMLSIIHHRVPYSSGSVAASHGCKVHSIVLSSHHKRQCKSNQQQEYFIF